MVVNAVGMDCIAGEHLEGSDGRQRKGPGSAPALT